jgi:hypothetical protein
MLYNWVISSFLTTVSKVIRLLSDVQIYFHEIPEEVIDNLVIISSHFFH